MRGKPERKSRVTMKDVALAAGVSQSTVSFVLNGMDEMRIAKSTRQRVLEAIDRLGYVPRKAGRPKNFPETRSLGLMIDEIATSPFGAITLDAAQEAAWNRGVLLHACMTGGDPDYENSVLQQWQAAQVDGVIYASILTRHVTPPAALFEQRAVLLNCYSDNFELASVTPAERRGGHAATRALIDAGYRRIAMITGEEWMEASRQRQEGFLRAMAAAELTVNSASIVVGNFLPSGGREATLRLLDQGNPPEAIFCANDLTALGAYEAIKERGLRVAGDIAVMGYDDQELAQHLHPPLSSVVLPHREMGIWCVNFLLEEREPIQHRIECPVVLRRSHLGDASS